MNIIFFVDSPFPFGNASSMRTRSLFKLFEIAGHNIHVICDYDTVTNSDECNEYSYEAIFDNNISFVKRQIAPYKSVRALKLYCKNTKIDCIVANARYDRVNKVAAFCRKEKIKLIIENCEWHHSDSFKLGRLDPRFYRNEKMMRYDLKKTDGFISISRLLHEHNESFGKKSVRIPTILDVENTPYSDTTSNEKITIAYTGSPGRGKEYLLPPIKALAENEKLQEKIEFHIYGPTYDAVLKNIGNNEELLKMAGESVFIHGQIPQNEVQEVLTKADYLLFLRPDRCSSHAGFPTKLGESFSVGTPVIANDTGDLSLYINSGNNGFLLNTYDDNEIKSVFEKIITLNEKEYCNLRSNARKTAEESFDYRKYVEEVNLLFDFNNTDTSKTNRCLK